MSPRKKADNGKILDFEKGGDSLPLRYFWHGCATSETTSLREILRNAR